MSAHKQKTRPLEVERLLNASSREELRKAARLQSFDLTDETFAKIENIGWSYRFCKSPFFTAREVKFARYFKKEGQLMRAVNKFEKAIQALPEDVKIQLNKSGEESRTISRRDIEYPLHDWKSAINQAAKDFPSRRGPRDLNTRAQLYDHLSRVLKAVGYDDMGNNRGLLTKCFNKILKACGEEEVAAPRKVRAKVQRADKNRVKMG